MKKLRFGIIGEIITNTSNCAVTLGPKSEYIIG